MSLPTALCLAVAIVVTAIAGVLLERRVRRLEDLHTQPEEEP